MPFLSDMLDQSRRQQDEEQALARENLAEASLLQAHLSHRSALHSRFRFDPAAVMDCLRAEVLGQEPALQAVEDMLKVVRADIADPRRPLFSALFLAVLATIPTILTRLFGIQAPFAASSVLIAVSVALETLRQIEAQMVMRHHKGFL